MKIRKINLLYFISNVTLDLIPHLIGIGIKDIAPKSLAADFLKVHARFLFLSRPLSTPCHGRTMVEVAIRVRLNEISTQPVDNALSTNSILKLNTGEAS